LKLRLLLLWTLWVFADGVTSDMLAVTHHTHHCCFSFMATQELRPILGNIQALQLYLVECKSGQVPWASLTHLRTLVLHQRWDANYDVDQLRAVSATLAHLELKLDTDAQVQHVCIAASP
jgi:hypothetical protein